MPFSASQDLVADGVFASKTGHDFGVLVVGAVGDINGDGFPDVASGNPLADGFLPDYGAGSVVVLLGHGDGFDAYIDSSYVWSPYGVRVYGSGFHTAAASTLRSAGDINGDGFNDWLIGAPGFGNSASAYGPLGEPAPPPTGAAFLIFGGPEAPQDLLVGYSGQGVDYIEFVGDGYDAAGPATGIGDFNGDGIADFVVGAPGAGSAGGKAYIVFGGSTLSGVMGSGSIDGVRGMDVSSSLGGIHYIGAAVSGAGDINGDGLDDLLISSAGSDYGGLDSGSAYIVFGRSDGLAHLDVQTLDGSNGFRIDSDIAGIDLGQALFGGRDVNGDGIADFVIGSKAGAYVVFGSAGLTSAVLSVADLDGTNGFRITSATAAADHFASDVALGDINGDGYADVIIGASYADTSGRTDNGAVYVVYGGPSAFAATVDVAALNGVNGFRLDGALNSSHAGGSLAVSDDLNGDAVDDLLVTGEAFTYIVYGQQDAATQTGTGSANTMYGGLGRDRLLGLDGPDTLHGLAGNDELDGGDGKDKLYGGDGDDVLTGGAGADRLEGGSGADVLTGGVDNDYLDGGAGADVMAGGAGNDVYVVDDAGDTTLEAADDGYDIVRTGLNWVLADNIEGLQLQGTADIDGIGNDLANNIQGNDGRNLLNGGAGVDTINGNDGDDVIVGGLGSDLLRGGAGADIFRVAHVFGPGLETDHLLDFSTAEGDAIDLSGIDAVAGGADDAFTLVAAFTRSAGQMTLSFASGITTLRLDIDGDGKADYQMKIDGDVTGDSGGWLL